MQQGTVSIRLELRLADDVPEGAASLAGGPATRFAGWLGLMATLETLTAQAKEKFADVDH